MTKSVPLMLAAAILGIGACDRASKPNEVVGTWLVHDTKAPFPMHIYVFNEDGTMQQANPDAGDPHDSDSDGKGVWAVDGNRVRGKWVQILADRGTHRLAGHGEYSFEISVSGDRLSGNGAMHLFDADNRPLETVPTMLTGQRVKLDR